MFFWLSQTSLRFPNGVPFKYSVCAYLHTSAKGLAMHMNVATSGKEVAALMRIFLKR